MQKSFDDDSCEYHKSHDWGRINADGFDTELALRAETFSVKWVKLYENGSSTHNADNTAIGGHGANRFNLHNPIAPQHRDSHPDSITERNKLILLDKKYFEFEASSSSCDTPIDTIDPNQKDNIDKYSSAFVQSYDQSDHDLESNASIGDQISDEIVEPKTTNHKTQGNAQIKTNKKKKGRTKYRPLTSDDQPTSSAANVRVTNTLAAAPPGAKVMSPLNNSRRMDLTKSGNYSLQFRL